ncbi:MAG: ABC transporter permease [Candidatus Thermoplasmatota archaeon]|nr:ABC transporter permease [Candidatus Thermoplasmatota archaeon]
MGFGTWLSEHIAEIILVSILVLMIPMVFFGFLLPGDLRGAVLIPAVFLLVVFFVVLFILALMNRLQLMMGLRNLVRHKSDTVIAILGFMIGTSIICSSLAIGDTMGNMIETLVYDSYYLRDEYLMVIDDDGTNYMFDGDAANEISDAVWSLNGNETMIDGVSWELELQGSIVNLDTELFEPVITLRAYSKETEDAFGPLLKDGGPIEFSLDEDEIYMTGSVAKLVEGEVGHRINITTREGWKIFRVAEVIDNDGRAAWGSSDIYFSLDALWKLYGIENATAETPGADNDWSGGFYNVLFISNTGGKIDGGELCPKVVEKVNERFKEIPHPVDPQKTLEITGDKKSNVDLMTQAMSQFTMMFLALGTFSIIAGITLIINIFVMLSEERKEEMGISRAVGMKRRHLRMAYLFEGTAYSMISSFVGVVLGAVTGYLIIFAVERIIESVAGSEFEILKYYSVSPFSLILAFIGGFSITVGTTLMITQLIAKLNIVSAIRNTPAPKVRFRLITLGWKLFGVFDPKNNDSTGTPLAKALTFLLDRMVFSGTLMFVLGVALLLLGFLIELIWPIFVGVSFALIGLGLIIRYFISERLTYNIVAALILFIYIFPTPEPIASYGADLEMFVISGVFMVSAAVLLLVWNTDIILWAVEKMVCALRFSPASIKMAVSYPIKKRFRTGVTIFMFALIIFTITTMSMIVHVFDVNIEEFEKSVGGGYDIIGISTIRGIDDLEGELALNTTDISGMIDWNTTVSLSYGPVMLNITGGNLSEPGEIGSFCIGVPDQFMESNGFALYEVAWDILDPEGVIEHTDRNAWTMLRESPDMVILDVPGQQSGFPAPFQEGAVSAGDNITVSSMDGRQFNKTVIAISRIIGMGAVILDEDVAAQQFQAADGKVHLIRLTGDSDADDVASVLGKELSDRGFIAISTGDLPVNGGYDIIGISEKGIHDLRSALAGNVRPPRKTDVHTRIDFDRSVSLTNGLLIMNMTLPYGMGYTEFYTNCGGIPDKFIETNGYGFNEVAWDIIDPDEKMEHNDRNVWNALKYSSDWVIVDSSFGESGFTGMSAGGSVEAGDNITVSSMNGTQYNKTVIGISKLMGFRLVCMYEPYAASDFNAVERNLHLISVKPGSDARDVANDMRRELIPFGFYAIVVEEIIEESLNVTNNFFNLFNAFLSLGLIIGIVGLGIVTLRSVYERRHEIGMMRAIGFKRRSVVISFLGESTFIAGSGLVIGAALGIEVGWGLWRDELSELFPEFGIPIVKILAIIGIALFFALASSVAPSFKAARVIPAEALRYE